jgi:hypothetical protein
MLLVLGFDASTVPSKWNRVTGTMATARTAQQTAMKNIRSVKRRVCFRDLENFGDMTNFPFTPVKAIRTASHVANF